MVRQELDRKYSPIEYKFDTESEPPKTLKKKVTDFFKEKKIKFMWEDKTWRKGMMQAAQRGTPGRPAAK